jgi:hypothetical protein
VADAAGAHDDGDDDLPVGLAEPQIQGMAIQMRRQMTGQLMKAVAAVAVTATEQGQQEQVLACARAASDRSEKDSDY